MKCRFCGKSTMYRLNSKDPICGDCARAVGGEWGWNEVKKLSPEQVFYALGIQEAFLPHDANVEEAWRARVAVDHLAFKRLSQKPTYRMGCFETILLLVLVAPILFFILLMIVSQ